MILKRMRGASIGDWFFVPEGQADRSLARTAWIAIQRDSVPRDGRSHCQSLFVPEGQRDRSLARSAWDGATPKEPSRRVRYDSRRPARRFDDWYGEILNTRHPASTRN